MVCQTWRQCSAVAAECSSLGVGAVLQIAMYADLVLNTVCTTPVFEHVLSTWMDTVMW